MAPPSSCLSPSSAQRKQRRRRRRRPRQRQRQRQRQRVRRDWSSGLPSDVVDEIISNLSSIGDRVRFSAVSSSWRRCALAPGAGSSSAAKGRTATRNPPPPWLMFPRPRGRGDKYKNDHPSSFYSFSERKLFHIKILPEIQWHECVVGSGKGWIITLNIRNGNLRLLDFLAAAASTTTLPSVNLLLFLDGSYPSKIKELASCYANIIKAVFFPSASLVFLIYGTRPSHLAFARLGDDSWNQFDIDCTCIRDVAPSLRLEPQCCSFTDVIFHKGQFYAVVPPGWILTLDLSSTPPRCTCLHLKPPTSVYITKKYVKNFYLVESPDGAELMQVFRLQWSYFMNPEFLVFKCKLNNDNGQDEHKQAKWEEVKGLDEWVLFLGDKNLSVALSTKEFPELTPNSIYFIHGDYILDNQVTQLEMGIFHLESRTIEPLLESFLPTHMTWPLPVWFPHNECFPVLSQIAKVEDITKRTKVKFDDKIAPVEIDSVPYRFPVEYRWMRKYPHFSVRGRWNQSCFLADRLWIL